MTAPDKPRAVVLGCVDFTRAVLAKLLERPRIEIVGVIGRRTSPANADFAALEPTARDHGLPWLEADEPATDLATWISDLAADVVFCCGWSRLLDRTTLDAPKWGVVGYHPSPLPIGRGRHPIIWALALGMSQTASTFFRMGTGADDGPIIDQRTVPIDSEDTAAELYTRLTSCAMEQLEFVTDALADGTVPLVEQDESRATTWRKRSREDGRIDWRMPAVAIDRLARALAPPYPGATCLVDGEDFVVRDVRVDDELPAKPHHEPGRVLAVDETTVAVRCGDGVVRLNRDDLPRPFRPGDYL